LCSASAATLVAKRTRTRFGDGKFAVSGPVTRNNLPTYFREVSLSASAFRRQLKTNLFLSALSHSEFGTMWKYTVILNDDNNKKIKRNNVSYFDALIHKSTEEKTYKMLKSTEPQKS
jgi:hypothetical protein